MFAPAASCPVGRLDHAGPLRILPLSPCSPLNKESRARSRLFSTARTTTEHHNTSHRLFPQIPCWPWLASKGFLFLRSSSLPPSIPPLSVSSIRTTSPPPTALGGRDSASARRPPPAAHRPPPAGPGRPVFLTRAAASDRASQRWIAAWEDCFSRTNRR